MLQGLKTRDILAAVYRGQDPGRYLTHTYSEGRSHTLCGKIPEEHLADEGSTNPSAAPTCKRCLARDLRFK